MVYRQVTIDTLTATGISLFCHFFIVSIATATFSTRGEKSTYHAGRREVFVPGKMLISNLLARFTAALRISGTTILLVAALQAQQPEHAKATSGRGPQPGQRTFTATCAACHGLDGRGGERAPNIAGSPRLQRLSDAELAGIVSNGVPGKGMPAFGSLGVAGSPCGSRLFEGPARPEETGRASWKPGQRQDCFLRESRMLFVSYDAGAGRISGVRSYDVWGRGAGRRKSWR